jgi:hypothetical protein
VLWCWIRFAVVTDGAVVAVRAFYSNFSSLMIGGSAVDMRFYVYYCVCRPIAPSYRSNWW